MLSSDQHLNSTSHSGHFLFVQVIFCMCLYTPDRETAENPQLHLLNWSESGEIDSLLLNAPWSRDSLSSSESATYKIKLVLQSTLYISENSQSDIIYITIYSEDLSSWKRDSSVVFSKAWQLVSVFSVVSCATFAFNGVFDSTDLDCERTLIICVVLFAEVSSSKYFSDTLFFCNFKHISI